MTDKTSEEYRKDQECKKEIGREARDKKKPDDESEKYRKRRQKCKDAINRYQQRARISCGATAKIRLVLPPRSIVRTGGEETS
ncbi:hypothetical protein BG006_006612 [Podila minutissima]|uniref:Uncharacterized protein n=1 Tax=Podila minutissima TaxID=64525 RepID=A0A9P5VLB2_9FUNG|nr:hypothetical protein BG006_006612 [Podila minutissima]